MDKDIMKNDKVVDDWEQGRQQGRPPSKVKPTTDIDEVRKKVLDNMPTGSYTELSN